MESWLFRGVINVCTEVSLMRVWWVVRFIGTWFVFVLLGTGSVSIDSPPQLKLKQSPSRTYYDARERLAATLTFEWVASSQVHIPSHFISQWNQINLRQLEIYRIQAKASGELEASVEESIKTLAEKVLLPEVDIFTEDNDYYLIERTPERLRFRMSRQSINLEKARNPQAENHTYHVDIYFQGNTVVTVHYDDNGTVSSVELAESGEKDALGLGSPSGTGDPCMLVFLGGVSPLRLGGSSPPQWRLVASTPEEWVFERINESKEMPRVKVHLDRRYQDAPSRLEIVYPAGVTYIWRTLKYKRVQGMWFPSEVECVVESNEERVREKYTLMRVFKTKEVNIDIPEGTPVWDRRKAGLGAWGYFGSEMGEETEEEIEEPEEADKPTRWHSTIIP